METREINLDVLSLEQWTPIASENPLTNRNKKWNEFDDAPMNLKTARDLRAKGLLLMAHRKTGKIWEVVVKKPDPKEPEVANKRVRGVRK